jgi:hypothetical protein
MVETFMRKLETMIDEYETLEAKQERQITLDHSIEYHESELDTASEDEKDESPYKGQHTERNENFMTLENQDNEIADDN